MTLDSAQKTGRTSVRPYSLDIDPAVVNLRIRRLALDLDIPACDLFLEGVDLMLKKRGRPSIAALTQKE